MAFVPLHNHSDYSLLDGASQLPSMVERAKELGMPAIALTDHGVMYGAIELLKLCKGTDLKPIIGNEMYVINGSIDDPQPKKEKRYHLVVLAKKCHRVSQSCKAHQHQPFARHAWPWHFFPGVCR
jgi:DNA polymerase-3 subunit alpha